MNNLALKTGDDTLWLSCEEQLRLRLGDSAFFSWIDPMTYMGMDGSNLMLSAPTELTRGWVEAHFLDIILTTVKTHSPLVDNIRIEVRAGAKGSIKALPSINAEALEDISPIKTKRTVAHKIDTSAIDHFYKDYTFDTFVVGECNRLVHSCAMTVAQNPGNNHYNPLVIYGKSGLGKTHILQAIGRFAVEHQTAHKVVYRTADDFLKDYMRAVRERRSEQFYRTYEVCDILILDDIQFLAKKVATQEELFKIFTRLLSKKKQIILSCDQLPSEVEGLDQKLLSRFQSGLCLSINPMDLQTRLDFLHRKASAEGFGIELSEESFRWLATHFRSNVRELEGVLVKLLGLREMMQMDLSLENIRAMVGEVVRSESASLSLATIAESTALAFGVKAELLATRSRVQSLALPRKVAIKLCRELTDHSLEAIGYQFNRDYSTVIASIKSIDTLIEEDAELRDRIEGIRMGLLT